MHSHLKNCVVLLWLAASWHHGLAQTREDFLQAPDRIEWEAGGLYEGRFDDGSVFEIELAYPVPATVPKRAAQGFGSAVWTPRHYTGTPSTLLAASSGDAQIRLAVADAQGVASSETYAMTLTPDRIAGRGVWAGPGTAGQRAFTLRRSYPYVGIVVTRPASGDLAMFSDFYRENGFVFSSFFPMVGERDADDWIREKAGECVDEAECANAVHVVWRSAALVSLNAMNYGYSGGAHGHERSETRHDGVTHGAMAAQGLDDFIDTGAACRAQVAKSIATRLRKLDMRLPDQPGRDAWGGAKFTPTPDGIAFHYDSYEAGSYAQGAPTVFVPREEMTACLQHLPTAD